MAAPGVPERPRPTQPADSPAGAAAALGAFLSWGLIPIFFKQLGAVAAFEIIAHRVVWSCLFLGAVAALLRGRRTVRALLADGRVVRRLGLTAMLIGTNWTLYVWAVNTDRLLETSLGYFITPLVNVLLGVAFLGERLRPLQWVAVACAAAGVTVAVLGHGALPWIALSLAVTFGFYGLVRKTTPVDAVSGLLAETSLLFPLAAGFLLWAGLTGRGAFLAGDGTRDFLLVLAGPLTAVPMLMFAVGARGLRLATLGFFQYLSPSCTFLLGVYVYGEPFELARQVTFALVWTGLAIYSFDAIRAGRRRAGK